MVGDVTCQSLYQRTWGTERENPPHILFQYLSPEVPPIREADRLMFYGLVVIDFVSPHIGISHLLIPAQSETQGMI